MLFGVLEQVDGLGRDKSFSVTVIASHVACLRSGRKEFAHHRPRRSIWKEAKILEHGSLHLHVLLLGEGRWKDLRYHFPA